MPDSLGLPTTEEISHYEQVLSKSMDAIRQLQVSPFDRQKFDEALEKLTEVYNSFNNPHFWGGSAGHTPLWDVPRHLRNLVDKGITPDMLPALQGEINQA